MSDLLPLAAPAYLLVSWLFLRGFVLMANDVMLFEILISMVADSGATDVSNVA